MELIASDSSAEDFLSMQQVFGQTYSIDSLTASSQQLFILAQLKRFVTVLRAPAMREDGMKRYLGVVEFVKLKGSGVKQVHYRSTELRLGSRNE